MKWITWEIWTHQLPVLSKTKITKKVFTCIFCGVYQQLKQTFAIEQREKNKNKTVQTYTI